MKQLHKLFLKWASTLGIVVLLVTVSATSAYAVDWNAARDTLSRGMHSEQYSIPLSHYGMPIDDFLSHYDDWRNLGHIPWTVENFTYYYSGGIVTEVRPNYWDPVTYSRARYEQQVQRILAETVTEDMSQWQIALSLYNYLAANVAYSESYPQYGGIQRSAYGAIVNRDAVCVGYAHAYMELLDRCGIPAIVVVSEEMNHDWNLVLINGSWYHVDVTWGDPLVYGKDAFGRVSHSYFLLSDAAISNADHEHYGWTAYYSCSNTYFDTDVFWKDLNDHIWYMDDSVSILRRSTNREIKIIRRNEYTTDETVLCTVNPASINITGTSLFYANYGISLWKDTVYFSDARHVYAVSPAGGEPTIVYTYDCEGNQKTILGSFVRDDTIFLTVKNPLNQTSRLSVPLPAGSHTHSFTDTDYTPTCLAAGYTEFRCTCGEQFRSGDLEPVACKGGIYTVASEPTWDTQGLKVANCVWCGSRIETILQALHTMDGSFGDVSRSDYFAESVLWAYVRGVTSGTAEGVFSPYNTCTRGQVVTFLWRAMGEPAPNSSYNPFHDVSPDAYYYKAVLWAVEQGITSGTSATSFSPDAPCTRAQVVTFLHRTAGSPAPMEPDRIPFTDVDFGGYYVAAMVWAVEQGITSGTDVGRFSPDNPCTRAQTVTFLQRYLTK